MRGALPIVLVAACGGGDPKEPDGGGPALDATTGAGLDAATGDAADTTVVTAATFGLPATTNVESPGFVENSR